MAIGTSAQLQRLRYQEVAPRRQVHMVFEFIVIMSIYFRFALLAHEYISLWLIRRVLERKNSLAKKEKEK
jgi:uncharacterized membrane protein (DUF485 family)